MIAKQSKDKKKRAPRLLKKLNLERANKQLQTILGRQIDKLMELSYGQLLSKDELANLALAQKLLVEFQKQEEEDLELLSDEELKNK